MPAAAARSQSRIAVAAAEAAATGGKLHGETRICWSNAQSVAGHAAQVPSERSTKALHVAARPHLHKIAISECSALTGFPQGLLRSLSVASTEFTAQDTTSISCASLVWFSNCDSAHIPRFRVSTDTAPRAHVRMRCPCFAGREPSVQCFA